MPFPSHAEFEAALCEFFGSVNFTALRHLEPAKIPTPPMVQAPQAEKNGLKVLFLYFLIPTIVIAVAFNLWLSFARPWENHRDDARYRSEHEDWLLVDSDIDVDGPLPVTSYNSVKEGPLSPDEVRRLIDIIRADLEASRDDMTTKCSGRKRKAGEPDSPISDVSTDDGSASTRTRKLKVETDLGVASRWMSEVPNYGSCLQEETTFDQDSGWSEFPFTFRVAHPDRAIRSASRRRSPNRCQ
ncbi:MAG: hypothetical protein Q9225_005790 [Loekoesia sp. 1 TL-2023]